MCKLRSIVHLSAAIMLGTALLAPASAQEAILENRLPQVVAEVVECRSLTEQQERLACYDRTVPALAAAHKEGDVFIADKEQVRKSREGLFGLTLPAETLFRSDENDEDEEALTQIDASIISAHQNRQGKWVFVLDGGAQWVQADNAILYAEPKPGSSKINIRRAAMGSYMAKVDGQRAMRVRRVVE